MDKIKLNPKFESLIQPEILLDHINNLKTVAIGAEQNPFPVEVFPKAVQAIITATNESLNFPIDFIGASILYAVSVAIGNTHSVEIMKGYIQNAVLYMVIVGRSGVTKSPPLSFFLKPIEQRDSINFNKYTSEKKEYDSIITLAKNERDNEPIKPNWKQYIVSDFTPESLIDIHKFNKRGLGVYVDELASWFKNFNRYNNGSSEQFWLSAWSGKPIRVNRKTSEPAYIPLPFISVAGTIQTGILDELAKNRTENGFLERLLFVMPKGLKKEYWSEKELNPEIEENWNTIISNLLDMPLTHDKNQNPEPEILQFTPEAKKIFFKWQKSLSDENNKPENEMISGIYAKMEMYGIRFALIIEIMRFACGESNKHSISIESTQGAIKLVEYFKNTAIRVHSFVSNKTPIDKLPIDKRKLYDTLPTVFTTSEGLHVAGKMGVSERTFKYFISKRNLFNNLKMGEYEKLF